MGCRVTDGHLFVLGIWERPDGDTEWRVDQEEVDAVVRRAFATYSVKAFYADPPYWQDYLDRWTRDFGA